MMIFNLIAQFGTGFDNGTGPSVFNPLNGASTSTICNATSSLEGILSLILGFLTTLAGLAFLLYFIFGGLQWTLAGGEQGKIDTAKKQMTNGAIGLVIIVISYGIIAIVGQVLGLQILNPGQVILELNPITNRGFTC